MIHQVTHTTEYVYHAPVNLCYNEARLQPRDLPYQSVEELNLIVDPLPKDMRRRFDYFGNAVVSFSIQHPHDTLTVKAISRVRLTPGQRPFSEAQDTPWESVRDRLRSDLMPAPLEARQFVLPSPLVPDIPGLGEFALPSFEAGRGILDAVGNLMHRIFTDFQYLPGHTSVTTPLEELLRNRRGVCQDFAHLALGCIRSVGLAARYVSGYIETVRPQGEPRLKGADASHAWFSLFIPDLGWVDYDPTNDQMPSDQHITVAWGRDYSDVPPLKGVIFSSGTHELKVAVNVEKLAE